MLLWTVIVWGSVLVAFVLAIWAWKAQKEAREKRERFRAWVEKEYGEDDGQ